jgi:hypothetical protein
MDQLPIIGRAEHVQLPTHSLATIPAKVDTGADNSSIWASRVQETEDGLSFVLFDEQSEYYTGQMLSVGPDNYRQAMIANSFGDRERRYVVKLPIRVLGRTIKASFALADRSRKVYPVLLGRKLLHNKFLVDVTKGTPLNEAECAELRRRHVALEEDED